MTNAGALPLKFSNKKFSVVIPLYEDGDIQFSGTVALPPLFTYPRAVSRLLHSIPRVYSAICP